MVMDSLAQTSRGWAEARATYKRRCGTARGRRQPRERRKVVASSAEEGPAVEAAAEVPRRRTAMFNSPERGERLQLRRGEKSLSDPWHGLVWHFGCVR
jgi:hypothetical protein